MVAGFPFSAIVTGYRYRMREMYRMRKLRAIIASVISTVVGQTIRVSSSGRVSSADFILGDRW